MPSSLFVFSLQNLSLGTIFLSLLAIFTLSGALVVLNAAVRRRALSKGLPVKKFSFFSISGNSSNFPLTESSKNGNSYYVFYLQVMEGYNKIFSQQKLFCFWIAHMPFIVLTKGEAVEAVMNGTKIMQKAFSYNFLHCWLSTGLLTSHGSKWKSRRKLLTPCFHFDILKDFLPVFNEQSQVLIKGLQQEITKDFTDIVTPITLCSLDIICETTLGVNIAAQNNRESYYVKAVASATKIIMERMINCLLWPDLLFRFCQKGKQLKKDLKLLHDFTKSVIEEKKRTLLNGEASVATTRKRKAFMDLLLEHHIQTKSLTEEDIREEVDTFAFEGHDTTALGMSWALYLIGLYKDAQQKVIEEIDTIFGGDVERPVTTDDLNDMKYLDCVLKESQRLYPSVPVIGRNVTEEIDICGYSIPKGANLIVNTYILHRDENVFPNPEKFDPDRFLPENSANRHPYAYVPFSAGPRNCIGQRFAVMEEKVVISSVLRNFTLHSLDERDKISPAPELILRPTGPLRVKIRPRHSTISSGKDLRQYPRVDEKTCV